MKKLIFLWFFLAPVLQSIGLEIDDFAEYQVTREDVIFTQRFEIKNLIRYSGEDRFYMQKSTAKNSKGLVSKSSIQLVGKDYFLLRKKILDSCEASDGKKEVVRTSIGYYDSCRVRYPMPGDEKYKAVTTWFANVSPTGFVKQLWELNDGNEVNIELTNESDRKIDFKMVKK